MRLRSLFVGLADFLSDLRRSVLDQRCQLDDSWGTKIGETADGHPVFECEYGHIFSPPVDIKDKPNVEP